MKRSEVDMSKISPMMAKYLEIKEKYNDTIIFYRLGDFYEMFFEDAILCSRELELTLTGRNAGLDERVPMCGVPHHAYLQYLEKLAKEKGIKIQTELKKGAIWAELIKSAEDFGANLILVGGKEHQNDSARNLIQLDKISRTNSEIIGSASCNVLVVNEPDIEKLFKIA